MKINWGTGIVIAFICFISFIMYFIISMNTNSKYDHDLVNEDYYKQELEFQNDINKQQNSKTLTTNVSWTKTSDGIHIEFPKQLTYSNITGNISFYRPSNKTFDFNIPITLKSHVLLIPKSRLLEGRWNIKIDWQYENENYLFKDDITY